jgi:hypothetical protein
MSIEDRPEHHRQAEPPVEEDPEMCFSGALTNLVDDLFTCQPIAEALRGTEGVEQIESFVKDWKQGLTEYLQETMEIVVENFAIDLKRFQFGQGITLSPSPNQEPNARDQDGQPT